MKSKVILRFKWVNKDIFDAIRSGKKKVETRAATIKYKNIKAGDRAVFICGGKKLSKKIKKVIIFRSVAALFKKYKPKAINPKARSAQDILGMYDSFSGYKEKIKKFGIIAMEWE